jgi:broad specificity phosphatase PhoE
MKIYVARHGRTNYNNLALCNADPTVNVYLTRTGIKQAKRLSEKLKDAKIERIFVSELRRTHQTADVVNEHHKAPVEIEARLNDNRTGFEGKSHLRYELALWCVPDKWTARFNDGESLEDVKERVRSFIDELKTKDYDSVLIITSKVIVQAAYGILRNATNQEARDLAVGNAGCMEFDV